MKDFYQEDEREACLNALRYAAEVLGHQPRADEYKEMDIYPSVGKITSTFGSWNEAIEAAGFEPLEEAGNHPNWRETRSAPPEDR